MPKIEKKESDIRIYITPSKYMDVDAKRFHRSVEAAKEATAEGQDVAYSMLAPLITVVGGKTPFDIKKGQDISLRRATIMNEGLSAPRIEGQARRIPIDGIEGGRAQQLLINDKLQMLRENGRTDTPEDVARAYNAELKGNKYPDMLHEILTSIVTNPDNEEARKAMSGLFDTYRNTRGIDIPKEGQ